MYDVPIYSNFFCERQIYWTLPHFCARIDLLFYYFSSAGIIDRQLQSGYYHFGFVMCVNSRLYCTHFSCHWRKIRNVSGRLTQISERQRDPCFNFSYYLLLNAISWLRYAFCACRPSGEIAIAIIEPHSLLWIQSIAQVQYNCPRWQWCCRLICRLPTHNGQESQGRNVWLWTECSEEIPRGESVDKLCVSVSSFLAITWTDKVI